MDNTDFNVIERMRSKMSRSGYASWLMVMKRVSICTLSFALCLMLSFQVKANDWDDLLGLSDRIKDNASQASQSSKASEPQFINRLDQEILVLRAEMSKRNGDVRQVERYLDQLEKQTILPPFRSRIEVLKQYVANNSHVFNRSSRFAQPLNFPMNNPKAVVAIVLPSSGDYEQVGVALQTALQTGLNKAGFRGKLIAIDSNLYGSAFEIWELLKFYQPDFVFGPLRKEMVAEWQALRTGVTSFYFNDIGYLGVDEFSLSPNRLAGLEQVFQIIQQGQYENVLVLKDMSEKSQELTDTFKQAWLSFNSPWSYREHVVEGNVGQSLDVALGVTQSKQRHAWVERVLKQPVEAKARTREDARLVISLLPQSIAIQVSPYLNFLSSEQELTHIWYPSQTPDSNYLAFNIDAWQQTFLILPQSVEVEKTRKQWGIDAHSKTGLFYALGQVAVKIVDNSTASSEVNTIELTEQGGFVRNASGQFHLLPIVYWADNGTLEKYYQLAE